jgi:arsenate reductase
MKRIYYLGTCDTCRRMMKLFDELNKFELIDIKLSNIDPKTLDFLKEKTGSFEALFSKRAIKYKTLGLKDKNLSDQDFRQLILDEYTFLKRPVLIDAEKVVIGKLI